MNIPQTSSSGLVNSSSEIVGISNDGDHTVTSHRFMDGAAQLRGSRELVEAILTQLPVTLFTSDQTGTIQLVEGQTLKRLGFNPGEMVGKNAFDLYRKHPNIIEGLKRGLAGDSCTVTCVHSSHVFDVRFSPLTNEFQELTGTVALVIDATERHRTAERLTDTNLRLQSIIHSLSDGVIVVKKDGRIEEVNHRTEEILGISRNKLIGAYPFESTWHGIHDDGHAFPPEESPTLAALKTGIPQRDVVMGVKLHDRALWLSIN